METYPEPEFAGWQFNEPGNGFKEELETENLIVDKSFGLALRIVRFTNRLRREGSPDAARQLFRCGTSIGAMMNEAQDPESRADFIHKVKIAAKEANEARFWLRLCKFADDLPYEEGLLEELHSIRLILAKILVTAQRNAG